MASPFVLQSASVLPGSPEAAAAEVAAAEAAGGGALRVYTHGACLNSGTRRSVGVFAAWLREGSPYNAVRCAGGGSGPGARPPGSLAAAAAAATTDEGERVTNQTMELAAALLGLEALAHIVADAPPDVAFGGGAAAELYTMSHYVINCMTRWRVRWEANGWVTKRNRAAQNSARLRRMSELLHALPMPVRFVMLEARVADVLQDAATAAADAYGHGPAPAPAPAPAADAPAAATTTTDPHVLGMREAWSSLVGAAHSSTRSGFTRRRGNVRCRWSNSGQLPQPVDAPAAVP